MPFASASTSAFALAFTSAKAALDMAVPIADRSNSPPPEVLPVSNHVPYNPHARILRDQKQKKFYRRPRFNTPLRYRNNPDTRPLIDLDHGQSNRRILSPKSPRATRGSKSKTRSNLPHTPSASSPNTENNIINGRRIRKRPAQDTEIDLVAANNGVQDTTVPVVVNRQGENPSINTLQNNTLRMFQKIPGVGPITRMISNIRTAISDIGEAVYRIINPEPYLVAEFRSYISGSQVSNKRVKLSYDDTSNKQNGRLQWIDDLGMLRLEVDCGEFERGIFAICQAITDFPSRETMNTILKPIVDLLGDRWDDLIPLPHSGTYDPAELFLLHWQQTFDFLHQIYNVDFMKSVRDKYEFVPTELDLCYTERHLDMAKRIKDLFLAPQMMRLCDQIAHLADDPYVRLDARKGLYWGQHTFIDRLILDLNAMIRKFPPPTFVLDSEYRKKLQRTLPPIRQFPSVFRIESKPFFQLPALRPLFQLPGTFPQFDESMDPIYNAVPDLIYNPISDITSDPTAKPTADPVDDPVPDTMDESFGDPMEGVEQTNPEQTRIISPRPARTAAVQPPRRQDTRSATLEGGITASIARIEADAYKAGVCTPLEVVARPCREPGFLVRRSVKENYVTEFDPKTPMNPDDLSAIRSILKKRRDDSPSQKRLGPRTTKSVRFTDDTFSPNPRGTDGCNLPKLLKRDVETELTRPFVHLSLGRQTRQKPKQVDSNRRIEEILAIPSIKPLNLSDDTKAGIAIQKEQEALRAAEEARKAAEERRKAAEEQRRAAEEKARRELEERLARSGGLRVPLTPFITPLPESWETRARDTLRAASATTLAVTGEGVDLRKHDFAKVVPSTEWLNDEIVNGSLNWLDQAINSAAGIKDVKRNTRKCLAMSSFFFKRLQEQGVARTQRTLRRCGVEKGNLLDVDTILLPICERSHWTLLVVRPTKRTVAHMDSLNPRGSAANVNLALAWIKDVLEEKFQADEWSIIQHEAPRQTNGHDCGVHTITNAMCVALGLSPIDCYTADDMPLQRIRIASMLLNGGFKGDFDLRVY